MEAVIHHTALHDFIGGGSSSNGCILKAHNPYKAPSSGLSLKMHCESLVPLPLNNVWLL